MTLRELKSILSQSSAQNLRFVLPDGDPIPSDFHVTEVGHVAKIFIDCGGTKRSHSACVLQMWVAENDPDHRLSPGKLATILEMAKSVIPSDDLEVEVEYERCVVSQYPLVSAQSGEGELIFTLGEKHTDCLAKEACGLESCGCGETEGKCC